jgi:hypothetical protein
LELFESWWGNFVIIFDIANQWRLKLHFIRKKFRGYDSNLKAAKRKNKIEYSSSIKQFEHIQKGRDLTPLESKQYKDTHIQLDKLVNEEEFYWQQRSKLKWFLEGDSNTNFFHTTTTSRKNKNYISFLYKLMGFILPPLVERIKIIFFFFIN